MLKSPGRPLYYSIHLYYLLSLNPMFRFLNQSYQSRLHYCLSCLLRFHRSLREGLGLQVGELR